jgi:hypothetical protein
MLTVIATSGEAAAPAPAGPARRVPPAGFDGILPGPVGSAPRDRHGSR